MVVPIIVGIGVTLVALTTRATIHATQKFRWLTPAMIASLNNIRIDNASTTLMKNGKIHPHNEMHEYLRANYPNTGFKEPMTEQEALLILGIEGDQITTMDKTLLKNRYRKLMIVNHPDKKGSKYLSQKINQAKDVLDKSYMFNK